MSKPVLSAKTFEPSIKDFNLLKKISEGAYGQVYLGVKKNSNPTDRTYAIKKVRKADIVDKNMAEYLINERNALVKIRSEYVVHLHYSLQDQEFVYLVMDFMIGGDLKSLIAVFGALDEGSAAFYVSEVSLALDYLHHRGIIHRDIKPDNLLISANGHVKLTDFGLCHVNVKKQKITVRDVLLTPMMKVTGTPYRVRDSMKATMTYTRTPGQVYSLTDQIRFATISPVGAAILKRSLSSPNNPIALNKISCTTTSGTPEDGYKSMSTTPQITPLCDRSEKKYTARSRIFRLQDSDWSSPNSIPSISQSEISSATFTSLLESENNSNKSSSENIVEKSYFAPSATESPFSIKENSSTQHTDSYDKENLSAIEERSFCSTGSLKRPASPHTGITQAFELGSFYSPSPKKKQRILAEKDVNIFSNSPEVIRAIHKKHLNDSSVTTSISCPISPSKNQKPETIYNDVILEDYSVDCNTATEFSTPPSVNRCSTAIPPVVSVPNTAFFPSGSLSDSKFKTPEPVLDWRSTKNFDLTQTVPRRKTARITSGEPVYIDSPYNSARIKNEMKLVPSQPQKQTLFGTPDYLAPELILKESHGEPVDYWALGICLFEFITGIPPFNDETVEQIFDNIINRRIPWHYLQKDDDEEDDDKINSMKHSSLNSSFDLDENNLVKSSHPMISHPTKDVPQWLVSIELIEALNSLLSYDANERPSLKELKTMKFFSNINFDDSSLREPPFVPQPLDSFDTSYFCARKTSNDGIDSIDRSTHEL